MRRSSRIPMSFIVDEDVYFEGERQFDGSERDLELPSVHVKILDYSKFLPSSQRARRNVLSRFRTADVTVKGRPITTFGRVPHPSQVPDEHEVLAMAHAHGLRFREEQLDSDSSSSDSESEEAEPKEAEAEAEEEEEEEAEAEEEEAEAEEEEAEAESEEAEAEEEEEEEAEEEDAEAEEAETEDAEAEETEEEEAEAEEAEEVEAEEEAESEEAEAEETEEVEEAEEAKEGDNHSKPQAGVGWQRAFSTSADRTAFLKPVAWAIAGRDLAPLSGPPTYFQKPLLWDATMKDAIAKFRESGNSPPSHTASVKELEAFIEKYASPKLLSALLWFELGSSAWITSNGALPRPVFGEVPE